MSIIRETKWALLELFPEQKTTEAEAEQAARDKILADAKAEEEARLQAEAEAAAKAAEEAGEEEEPPKQPPEKKKSVLDEVAAEMASIDLVAAKQGKQPSSLPETEQETETEPEAEAETTAPENDDPPVSLEPEGERPHGVLVRDYARAGIHIDVFCAPEMVVDAARLLNEAGFTLEAVTGVDWIKEEQMEVVYDYSRTDGQLCRVAVRTRVSRSELEVPTISEVYPGANWHERETHEFFGIRFQGHPNLVPLLLPEDADFHPLLKDFQP